MKRILILMLLAFSLRLASQEIPLEHFKGIKKCYVKTHRILPAYDLKRTYVTTKNYYEFDDQNRIKEITNYNGNDAYHGYYTYSYSDTLDVRSFYSVHNCITERLVTKYLNEQGDIEKTLYSWGGKILNRTITTTNPKKHETLYQYYNDAGYPLYTDLKINFPDGRVEMIITDDYDGFPVYYDYFVYDENKRLDSQRKVNYLDSLVTVVEYDYDDKDNLIRKATIDFKTNKSIIENFSYDMMGRLDLETVYEKSQYFGGMEELIMKREIYYENYPIISAKFHKGDQARENLESKLSAKAKKENKKLAKLKAKQDRKQARIDKKEKRKLDKENRFIEERDVKKLEKATSNE
ncbi:MAG: hypothetical protein WC155_00615 [Candidatus Cloacimonadales bacterium]